MASLNFKHLRYFWAVAKSGSIARASAQLHVTPQSISDDQTDPLARRSCLNRLLTNCLRCHDRLRTARESVRDSSIQLFEFTLNNLTHTYH